MMKHILTSVGLSALVAIAAPARGQAQSVRLAVAPDSKLWVEGSSNLHDWSCKASSIDAAIDVDAELLRTATASPALLHSVEVKVPVHNLQCGNGKMDQNLYKALKADAAPQIGYILARFDVLPGEPKDSFRLATVGALTVAGTERPVKMDVVARRLPDGSMRADGEVPLLMTDYGVNPPTALLGTLRTSNKVTVKFSLLVRAATMTAAMTALPAAPQPR